MHGPNCIIEEGIEIKPPTEKRTLLTQKLRKYKTELNKTTETETKNKNRNNPTKNLSFLIIGTGL